MFNDRTKLERVHLDELTKIGNMFDTMDIGYCVIDSHAMLSYGITAKSPFPYTMMVEAKNKDKIMRTIFKLNYIIASLSPEVLSIKKNEKGGELNINICFCTETEKKISLKTGNRTIFFPVKMFSQERKETCTQKCGKGYFRVAPLEALYLLKMDDNAESLYDLETIKQSGKMDFDKLLELFEINGLL
ncbi:MAG: hypothetical protein PHC66_03650 [Candidatus Nanoarchaeia archaeon]|nr:hypothetical protein [Candidatus Nanoarchaeia archaeon]MDD5238958.1 hypothetical protein [Candidatus Nanoarchaeia archaeon]